MLNFFYIYIFLSYITLVISPHLWHLLNMLFFSLMDFFLFFFFIPLFYLSSTTLPCWPFIFSTCYSTPVPTSCPAVVPVPALRSHWMASRSVRLLLFLWCSPEPVSDWPWSCGSEKLPWPSWKVFLTLNLSTAWTPGDHPPP